MSTTTAQAEPKAREGKGKGRKNDPAALPWKGPKRRYDIVKEFVVALVVVSLLTLALAALFSSPDEPSLTLAAWAKTNPKDFVAAATAELDGSSASASYGAPYENIPDAGQKVGSLNLQKLAGVRVPVDPARAFVITPLGKFPAPGPDLTKALATWKAASPDQQTKWAAAYTEALAAAPDGDPAKVAKGDFGPVPVLTDNLLTMAQSGALDGPVILAGRFYQTNYTNGILFLGDGTFLEDKAVSQNLGGDQSGMMNETGSYPGQAWLWLYTFWYQIKPFSDGNTTIGANADAVVWFLMMLLSLLLLLVPFIPGIRSIPRWIPLHRLIWRDWYRSNTTSGNRSS